MPCRLKHALVDPATLRKQVAQSSMKLLDVIRGKLADKISSSTMDELPYAI